MGEPRVVVCQACLGEGEIEHGHPNAPDAAYVSPCGECDGQGWVEIETEPVDEEDLWPCE